MQEIPENPNFKEALERFVLDMPIAIFLRIKFTEVSYGSVEIAIPYRDELSYAPGSFQAGPIGTLMDIAACSAIGTRLPPDWTFATIDYTTKILAPANGDSFIARGRAISSGRTISVGAADVFAVKDGAETLCATGLVTTRNFKAK